MFMEDVMKTPTDNFNKLDKFQLSCLLFAFASVLALLISYALQHIFHKEPCILANYQRQLHFFVLLLSILFLANRYRKFLVYSMFISYIAGSSIAFYHAGLALDIFPDIVSGTTNKDNYKLDRNRDSKIDSKDLDIMVEKGKVRHGENQFAFSFPVAAWHLFYSIGTLLVVYTVYKRQIY